MFAGPGRDILAENDKLAGIEAPASSMCLLTRANTLPMFIGICMTLWVEALTNRLSLKCKSWPSQPSGLNLGQQPVVFTLASYRGVSFVCMACSSIEQPSDGE
jgi:hypothetical protein